VVHGDLKGVRDRSKPHLAIVLTPGQRNILVDDSGHPRITDIGLVDTETVNLDLPHAPSSVFTSRAPWTAPEIVNGNGTYSKGADVFSFAMVMVEVCCRYPP